MEQTESVAERGLSRRTILKGLGAGTAVAWAAPQIVSTAAAGAQTGSTPCQTVGTVAVPTDGTVVTGPVLNLGTTYRLVASGTFIIGTNAPVNGDAEYAFQNNAGNDGFLQDGCNNDPFNNADLAIYVDSGGGAHSRPAATPPYWISAATGPAVYNPGHVYFRTYTGTGGAISFDYSDCFYGDNSGTLTVEIQQCG